MKILLLGKSGMLGSQFLKLLSGNADFESYAPDRSQLDITDRENLNAVFERISPDFVINCIAYTAVDDCESNRDVAMSLNGDALGDLAKVCHRENASLLHFSTDYVFDGSNSKGYKEDDQTSPINVYGESKLLGEKLIAENMTDFYVVRTSWLFGENGRNFVDTMVKLGKEKDSLSVVDDQIGSPTYTNDLVAYSIKHFLSPFVSSVPTTHDRAIDDKDYGSEVLPFGVFHATNSDTVSWFGFAKEIFSKLKMDVELSPVASDAFVRPAKRPACSILLNTKIPDSMRSWKEALSAYLALNY